MNKVSILLVDNPSVNITEIDSALKEAELNYALHFAGNGKNGLDILMGDPYHEVIASDDIKMKPTVVILSKDLQDISALEFLGIIGRYYSLRDTKVFLLSDSLTDSERLIYQGLGINGYLQRPLSKEQVIQYIKPQLNDGQLYFTFMPLGFFKESGTALSGLIRNKIISLYTGAKIAACIVLVLTIGSGAMYHAHDRLNESLTSGAGKTILFKEEALIKDSVLLPSEDPGSLIKSEPVDPVRPEPAPKVATAIPVSVPDTLQSSTQNTDSLPYQKPDLRIVVIEEPDSIQE